MFTFKGLVDAKIAELEASDHDIKKVQITVPDMVLDQIAKGTWTMLDMMYRPVGAVPGDTNAKDRGTYEKYKNNQAGFFKDIIKPLRTYRGNAKVRAAMDAVWKAKIPAAKARKEAAGGAAAAAAAPR